MLQRTIDDAARVVPNLQVGNVFERKGLQRLITVAGVLVATIIGLGLTNAEAMDRWYKAYVLRLDRYWKRETDLTVKVLVQPGDRIRGFRNMRYKHARGSDLTLIVEIPEGKRRNGEVWKIPETVTLQYRLDDGRGSGSVNMTRYSDRQFRHTIGSLLDGMNFWVKGGDYVNRDPYRVEVVDPPRVDQITLNCDFPAHTGMNAGQTSLKVQGAQISIPAETRFQFHAAINKPLLNVRCEFGAHRLLFGYRQPTVEKSAEPENGQEDQDSEAPPEFFAEWYEESEDGQSRQRFPLDEAVAKKFLAEDGKSFTLPMALSAAETDAARDRSREPMSGFGLPFVLSPGTSIRIYLEDTDDIVSAEPARLVLNGASDNPPTVATQLKGVGSSITRKAIIPMTGFVTDDYGLTDVRFDFRLEDDPMWSSRPFRAKLVAPAKEFQLGGDAEDPKESFDVLPMELAIGKKLTLTVTAIDGDNLNGPHEQRGEQYNFTIVTNEELLSILYEREVNLRQRFKTIMDELERARKDLILHRAKVQEADDLKKTGGPNDAGKIDDLVTSVAICAERTLHQVRKNSSETAVIEDGFRAILEELVNNRVHTEQMVQRINGLIVDPLHAINTIDYPAADGAVGLFKLALEKDQDPTAQIDNSVESLSLMLEHMARVLKEMQDLADFHEAIKALKVIIDDSEKLNEETIKERKKKDLEKLKGLDLLK